MSEKDTDGSPAEGLAQQGGTQAERTEKIMAVTPKMLADFLNEKAPGVMCGYCGESEYFVPPDPEGKTAAVVTAPVPHAKGVGVWAYMLVCPNCGHTAFFNAHVVSAKIVGDE